MPQIIILPHAELCPEGQVFEAPAGQTILDAAKANGIDIEHACEKIMCLHHLSRRCA